MIGAVGNEGLARFGALLGAAFGVALALSGTQGCAAKSAAPRGQIVIVVDTDAPVPKDVGDPGMANSADAPSPLVDVARVEVLLRGTDTLACPECRRDLVLDEGRLRRHEISLGIVASARSLDVRVRLFALARVAHDSEPKPGASIDVRAQVAKATGGLVTQMILAPVARWGVPSAIDSADAPVIAEPGPSKVGAWEGARIVPCTTAPRPDSPSFDGERCIPGGAYVRSDPRETWTIGTLTGPLRDPRLVVVSPFVLERDEYTVGRYRRDFPDGPPPGVPEAARYDEKDPQHRQCTLGSPRPDVANVPLNCVTFELAQAICAKLGARLPTETELEFAASGRGEDRVYTWGDESPFLAPPADAPSACCDAVIFERRASSFLGEEDDDASVCATRVTPPFGGPRPARLEPVDFIETTAQAGNCARVRDLSRDGVRGLNGSVTEWTRDFWGLSTDPCWHGTTSMKDPVCTADLTTAKVHSRFGGGWDAPLHGSRFRIAEWTIGPSELGAGVRCARDGGAR